nr:unnamed protein product [Callosobruchus analis]
MPRQYKRKLGARRYMDYDQAKLEQALQKVTGDGWSLRCASAEFKIPFGILRNKFCGLRIKKIGDQTVFTESDERAFIKSATLCAEWGFPLAILDIRYLAKNYLDRKGRSIERFHNNMPEVVRQESEYFIPQFENIEVGNFILVRVLGGSRKKTVYRYIAIVERVISEEGKQELELLGMKSSDKSRKLFAPQQDDKFLSATEDVIAILPTPSVIDEHGKITYLFEKKLMSSKCNNIVIMLLIFF